MWIRFQFLVSFFAYFYPLNPIVNKQAKIIILFFVKVWTKQTRKLACMKYWWVKRIEKKINKLTAKKSGESSKEREKKNFCKNTFPKSKKNIHFGIFTAASHLNSNKWMKKTLSAVTLCNFVVVSFYVFFSRRHFVLHFAAENCVHTNFYNTKVAY